MRKILSLLVLATLSSTAMAEGNFLNLASTPAKIDSALKESLDKPFRQFAQDWMKDSKLAAASRLLQGKLGVFEKQSSTPIERKFWVSGERESEKMAIDAVGTFKAWCEHHQGQHHILPSEIFCLKDNKPIAWMEWFYREQYQNFIMNDGNAAKAVYQSRVLDIEPGKTIVTSYGSALVLEKGQNGLIKIQPLNGGGSERWITTDHVRVRW